MYRQLLIVGAIRILKCHFIIYHPFVHIFNLNLTYDDQKIHLLTLELFVKILLIMMGMFICRIPRKLPNTFRNCQPNNIHNTQIFPEWLLQIFEIWYPHDIVKFNWPSLDRHIGESFIKGNLSFGVAMTLT